MIAAFVRLSRLKFLVGGFLGVAIGTAVAAYEGSGVDWAAYALAQVVITALQLMTQYANEVFDLRCDAHAERTPFSGGSGVLVDGTITPRIALVAALLCGAAGSGTALAFVFAGKVTAAAIVWLIAILAWGYSAPPLRLLARGWGEVTTAIVVAILVPVAGYAAQSGTIDLRVLASTLPGAAAMFVMMIAVEVPDAASDDASGKRTLVVRLGRRASASLVVSAIAAGIAGTGVAIWYGAPAALVPLLLTTTPATVALLRALRAHEWTRRGGPARIAGLGVALFFVASLSTLLAYGVVAP